MWGNKKDKKPTNELVVRKSAPTPVATEDDAEYKVSVGWDYSFYYSKNVWVSTVYHWEQMEGWTIDERGRHVKQVGMGWVKQDDFENKIRAMAIAEAEMRVRKLKSQALQYETNRARSETRFYK